MGHPGFLKTYDETKEWLDSVIYDVKYNLPNYIIDPDTLIVTSYRSRIFLKNDDKYILVQFGGGTREFIVYGGDNLLSLKGVPINNLNSFRVNQCPKLVTLEHLHKGIQTVDVYKCDNLITTVNSTQSKQFNIFPKNPKGKIRDKYNRYLNYLNGLSVDDRHESLKWLMDVDPILYSQFLKYSKSKNFTDMFTEGYLNIALTALDVNHKLA